jgi:hypothetical protein
MKRGAGIFSFWQKASGLFLVLTLLWLTISTPFVNEARTVKKEMAKLCGKQAIEDNNPFSNTTEEKNESSFNSLSEYLHEVHIHEPVVTLLTRDFKCHRSDTYLAFHPDLLIPPPKS